MKSCGVQALRVNELAESPARRPADRQAEEGAAILAALPRSGLAIVLDERGRTMSSPEFADYIWKRRADGVESMSFVIGGPDGLSAEVRERAALLVSFGKLTLPHQMVRALLLEQLYRAATIQSGHPYHRA